MNIPSWCPRDPNPLSALFATRRVCVQPLCNAGFCAKHALGYVEMEVACLRRGVPKEEARGHARHRRGTGEWSNANINQVVHNDAVEVHGGIDGHSVAPSTASAGSGRDCVICFACVHASIRLCKDACRMCALVKQDRSLFPQFLLRPSWELVLPFVHELASVPQCLDELLGCHAVSWRCIPQVNDAS